MSVLATTATQDLNDNNNNYNFFKNNFFSFYLLEQQGLHITFFLGDITQQQKELLDPT